MYEKERNKTNYLTSFFDYTFQLTKQTFFFVCNDEISKQSFTEYASDQNKILFRNILQDQKQSNPQFHLRCHFFKFITRPHSRDFILESIYLPNYSERTLLTPAVIDFMKRSKIYSVTNWNQRINEQVLIAGEGETNYI